MKRRVIDMQAITSILASACRVISDCWLFVLCRIVRYGTKRVSRAWSAAWSWPWRRTKATTNCPTATRESHDMHPLSICSDKEVYTWVIKPMFVHQWLLLGNIRGAMSLYDPYINLSFMTCLTSLCSCSIFCTGAPHVNDNLYNVVVNFPVISTVQ